MSDAEPLRHRRRKLRGISSRQWSFVGAGIGIVVLLVLTVFLVLALGPAQVPVPDLLPVMQIPMFVVAVAYYLGQRSIDAREISARYTTDPWRNPQVEFVDWKTGWVLREAGEAPFTSKQQLLEARAGAESWVD
jgi:hypothetical protein